ncbi:metal ABC transporter solute-binding protein, Zn/Mn family [Mastigocladopsis repens]|uniref:metal ABC transporter solute-binding protein, Zn/Mn family n=1 Tax=Mastigocladopsis repens TaxID=221287 RepID=UPI000474D6BD|nr:zinc ABC transporter substrate-binding protein [Mastigocladopsis repens]
MSKKLRLTQPLPAFLVAVAIGLFGCRNLGSIANTSSTATVTSAELNNNLPKVVATTSILCNLTKQIAQQTINLTCLIPPNANPQLYQPKPEDRRAIEQATLILYNGYNLEPGLLKLIRASKNSRSKIAVAQNAVPKPLQFRRNGKTLPDPYIWHNSKNGIRMVEVISSNLGKAIPENASLYSNNAQKVKNELTKLDSWIKSRIASIPANQRELVTNQDVMGYYAKAYDLSYAPALKGISAQGKPNTARVKALARYIKRSRITTLFADTTNNSNLITSIAQDTKVKVSERKLFSDNLDASGSEADTYQKMMVANTRTIVEGLGGTYLIFEPIISKSPTQGR